MIGDGLLEQLRSGTADAHRRLETTLGLLEAPLERRRFVRALRTLHAFHSVWEPAARATLTGQGWTLAPRAALIERDLAALGEAPTAAGPAPWLAETRAADPAAVWGGVYVVEGSALGGAVIAKALRRADWLPAVGLVSFDPHGPAVAARWADCRARLQALPPENAGLVAASARAAFEALLTLAGETPRRAAA